MNRISSDNRLIKEAAHLYTNYGFKLVEEIESTAFGRTEKEQRYDII